MTLVDEPGAVRDEDAFDHPIYAEMWRFAPYVEGRCLELIASEG